jgi:AraC-like DNA-binding protein
MAQSSAYDLHVHLAGQIYFLEAGLVTIDSRRERLLAAPRRPGWIPPGTPHRALDHGPISGLVGYVSLEACESLPPEPAVLEAGDLIGPLMARLAAFKGSAADQRTLRLAEALLDELALAPRAGPGLPIPQSEALRELAASEMDAEMAGDVSDWAKRLGVSPRTLTRRFVSETGLTPRDWRRALRLAKARELLAEGEAVSQTAWRVGYESVAAFIQSFKAVYGLTPGAWAALALGAGFEKEAQAGGDDGQAGEREALGAENSGRESGN